MSANSLFLLSADKLVAKEFEALNDLTGAPQDEEEFCRSYESALKHENYGTKNRYSDILPIESTRVKLRVRFADDFGRAIIELRRASMTRTTSMLTMSSLINIS